jgi:hypothetical protein
VASGKFAFNDSPDYSSADDGDNEHERCQPYSRLKGSHESANHWLSLPETLHETDQPTSHFATGLSVGKCEACDF